MSDPTILALDLAAKTGWAFGAADDPKPQSGSFRFARTGASMGEIFSNAVLCLDDLARSFDGLPKIVVFEAPLVPMFKAGATNFTTIRLLIGLTAIAEGLFHGITDCREAKVSDIRRHFIGTNRVRRAQAKAMTISTCRRLGWNPVDDNAADALALWHYQASILNPKLSIETSPLFRRGLP